MLPGVACSDTCKRDRECLYECNGATNRDKKMSMQVDHDSTVEKIEHWWPPKPGGQMGQMRKSKTSRDKSRVRGLAKSTYALLILYSAIPRYPVETGNQELTNPPPKRMGDWKKLGKGTPPTAGEAP